MNGLGSSTPGLALPGVTPWRTITVSSGLKPIVETTVPFDVVEPLYEPSQEYKFGRSTWSWIMWQDPSINYDDQIRFIDLASEMGYEYTLIDGGWERTSVVTVWKICSSMLTRRTWMYSCGTTPTVTGTTLRRMPSSA